MTTLLYTHSDFGDHETPPGHPERSARYDAVQAELASPDLEALMRKEAPRALPDMVYFGHDDAHKNAVFAVAAKNEKLTQLDPDTWMGAHSLDATLRAVGAGVEAVDKVMAGEAANAFIAARPPGHHAEPDKAMGFCLFNAAAIAALYAQAAHGCDRVAVVDFDVHHGNGTQAIFWDKPDTFFASSHEWPQYPGTGAETDRGAFDHIHNKPLASCEGSYAFRQAWGEHLLPALDDFDPDFIVISAGFDGHAADPLGGLNLTEEDFSWVTQEICGLATVKCDGHIISFMEGGYDLEALGKSAAAHVKALASL
jgi:acetoin utilization deacetylase AcuC-like enzyme